MKTEFLIIGQGISGTFLSWYLKTAGRSFIVIDKSDPASASRIAAGLINPVTGRRIVQTWMIDTLLPFALKSYVEFGNEIGVQIIHQKDIIDFFPSPQMVNAFNERINEGAPYLSLPSYPDKYRHQFNYDFNFGMISPCYVVDLQTLLSGWRNKLISDKALIVEQFDLSDSVINESGVRYKDVHAEKIIFCDGIQSASYSFFSHLPFAFNKGETLVIEAEGLPAENVFKKAMNIVPLSNDQYWVGSSYEWNFNNAEPSLLFLDRTTNYLQDWLKIPFKVISHFAALRPATIERRPFAGIHPYHSRIGILNGMGTKGCSLAPYFADQLANHLTKNTPILAEANLDRFTRILKP